MSKLYSIENEKAEKSKIEEKQLKEKYYKIYVDGMQYGNLIRKTYDYNEALDIFRAMKKTFSYFKCKVVIEKILEFDDNTQDICNICKIPIGKEHDLQYKLNQIVEILDDIDNLKRYDTAVNRDSDVHTNAFKHVMEEENTEDLTDKQLRNIVRKVEEKGALRRLSKTRIDYLTNMTQNLGSIRSNVSKCLDICKKLDYHNNTEKAKQNSITKSQEYRDIIGI